MAVDMTAGETDPMWANIYGVCVGPVEVSCEYEDIDVNPIDALIESLEDAVQQEIADSQLRKNKLLSRISELKAITHQE